MHGEEAIEARRVTHRAWLRDAGRRYGAAMPSLTHPEPPLAGDGVVLRPWCDADLPRGYEATQDPSIVRFTHVPESQTLAQLRVFVHGLPRAAADGEQLPFVIADARTDDLLGTIAVLRPSWEDARAELGYWLAPWGRGRGAATIATRLLAHWALDALPLQRLELRIDADNPGSQAVALRAGFTQEGTLRSFEERKGKRVDVTVWSLLATDPR